MRIEYDFYPTPPEEIRKILDLIPLQDRGAKVLEPSAGNGNIVKEFRNRYPSMNITSVEIREEERNNLLPISSTVVIGDFLEIDVEEKYDVIIGNPPFSLALEFVKKCLQKLNDGGVLILLLRTAFLESKKRYDFWQENPVNNLYVLSKRPSFTGKGTDQTCYSWFVWDKRSDATPIKVI